MHVGKNSPPQSGYAGAWQVSGVDGHGNLYKGQLCYNVLPFGILASALISGRFHFLIFFESYPPARE